MPSLSKLELNSSQRKKEQFTTLSGTTKISVYILNNKRTYEGITILDLKLNNRTIVIKMQWYWYTDRKVDE